MSDIRNALIHAVLRILRPLARIVLKHGMSYAEFAEIAKRAFVDVADKEFQIEGRKQSVSRICVLTGMHRKDVNRLLKEQKAGDWQVEPLGRAARVIGGWLSDEMFLTKSGRPNILAFEGDDASFSVLVKRYSGDMPARAVLDELKRAHAVEVTETGKLKLVTEAYVPHETDEERLQLMGTAGYDLFSTISHNIDHPPEASRLQLSVTYDHLSPETAKEFKRMAEKDAMEMLKRYNAWLAARDQDHPDNKQDHQGEKVRAGLGIFYIEDRDAS